MSKHRALEISVAIVALVGCDQVFGLDSRPAEAGIDQAVGAAPVAMSIDPVTDVAINDVIPVTAHIVGPPNTSAIYEFTATRGTYSQPMGADLIDPNGELTVTVMYTAPATPGGAMLGVNVAGSSKVTTVDVLTRSFEGNDIQLPSMSQWAPQSLYATPITVAHAGTLRSIGMRNDPSAGNVKFAIYRDDATRTKIAETGQQPIGGGRTVVPAPHEVIMAAGKYWVAGTVDTYTDLSWSAGTVADAVDIKGQIFSAGFANDLSGANRMAFNRFAVFIELAYSSGL